MQDPSCPGPPGAQIPSEQNVLHRVLPCTCSGSAALRSQEATGSFWGEISVFLLLQGDGCNERKQTAEGLFFFPQLRLGAAYLSHRVLMAWEKKNRHDLQFSRNMYLHYGLNGQEE